VSADGGALEAIDRILDRGGDADDVLREVVAALYEHIPSSWIGISFFEQGRFVLGPSAGESVAPPTCFSVTYDDRTVAELAVSSDTLSSEDRAILERVASLIGPHCLVGWDTGGEAWSP
jgi:putative methionine-R-sulfoxide reductase with GAF domain